MIATLYGSSENAAWFIFGVFVGFVIFILLAYICRDDEDEQQPQVVDAHFVVRPHTQLSSSQALVKRSTSLTTNQSKGITRR